METWIIIAVPTVLVLAYIAARAVVRGNPATHVLFERELRESIDREATERARVVAVRADRLRRIRQGLTTAAERDIVLRESAEAIVSLEFARELRQGIEKWRKEFIAGKRSVAEAMALRASLLKGQTAKKEGMIAERMAAWKLLGEEIFNL